MTDIVAPDAPQRPSLVRFPEAHLDAYVSIAPDWTYQEVTIEAAEQLGRTVEDMLGHRLWDVFPGVDGTPFGVFLRDRMERRLTCADTVQVRMPVSVDGVERDVCAALRPERRSPGGLFITFRWATITLAQKLGVVLLGVTAWPT